MEGGLAEEAHRGRLVGGARERAGGVVEPVLGLRDAAEHRSACTSPHESPIGVRRPTASVASRVAVAVSPTISEPNARGSRLAAVSPGQAQRPVRRQGWPLPLASTTSGRPCWMDEERLVPLDVCASARRSEISLGDRAGAVEVVLGEGHVAR